MDNITHTLTGLMMSRAGGDRLPRYAAPVMMLAANVPDVDVISGAFGTLTYLDIHRGHTHAIAFLPLMALPPLLIVKPFAKESFRWLPLYVLSLLAVASHLALDWTNVYAIRLLLPFSDRWLRADITHVVDAWILLALGLAIAAPWLSRLVSSEIGAPKTRGRGSAIVALLFLLAYDAVRWVSHDRAIEMLNSRMYEGQAPLRVAAFPNAFWPFTWTGYTETAQAVGLHRVDVLGSFDPTLGDFHFKPEASPVIEAARRDPEFQRYLNFAQFPFWRLTPLPEEAGSVQVEVMDLRFAPPGSPAFVIRAVVDGQGRVRDPKFSMSSATSIFGGGR